MRTIEVDEALVRAVLREQCADLAGLALTEVDGGWGNMTWRLGDDLAVRMPRIERDPALLRREQRWLPTLARSLPLPTPVPVRVGEPSARFPYPWTVVEWVPGEPADRSPMQRADGLAGFLRALHREAPADAPAGSKRAVPPAAIAGDFDHWVRVLGARPEVAAARRVWQQAVAAPGWGRPPVWVHGDLHPANVVVANGTLCGVLDFEEMSAGDPAADLAAAWVLLPAGAAAGFFEAYGDADEATVHRARGWAVLRAMVLISIGDMWAQGLPGGKQTWGPAGEAALDRALNPDRL